MNDRQKAFALALVENGGDARRAAQAAGYSERFARSRRAGDLAREPEMAALVAAIRTEDSDAGNAPVDEPTQPGCAEPREALSRDGETAAATAAAVEIVGPLDRQRFLTRIIRDDKVDYGVKLRALELLEKSQAREAEKSVGKLGLEDVVLSERFQGLRTRARGRLRRLLAVVFEARVEAAGGSSRAERLLTERLGETPEGDSQKTAKGVDEA